MADKIRAIFVFEVLGRPEKYLREIMKQIISKLSEEKNIKILEKEVHKTKKIQNPDVEGELFSCFAEIEIEAEELSDLFRIIFAYMPSHIDIIEPSELGLKNFDLTSAMNELIRRLHQYDAIAKKLQMEKNILKNQLENQGEIPKIPELPQPPQKIIKKNKIKKPEKSKTKKGKK